MKSNPGLPEEALERSRKELTSIVQELVRGSVATREAGGTVKFHGRRRSQGRAPNRGSMETLPKEEYRQSLQTTSEASKLTCNDHRPAACCPLVVELLEGAKVHLSSATSQAFCQSDLRRKPTSPQSETCDAKKAGSRTYFDQPVLKGPSAVRQVDRLRQRIVALPTSLLLVVDRRHGSCESR